MAGFAIEMLPGWDVSDRSQKGDVPNTMIHWNFMARMGTEVTFKCQKLERGAQSCQ